MPTDGPQTLNGLIVNIESIRKGHNLKWRKICFRPTVMQTANNAIKDVRIRRLSQPRPELALPDEHSVPSNIRVQTYWRMLTGPA